MFLPALPEASARNSGRSWQWQGAVGLLGYRDRESEPRAACPKPVPPLSARMRPPWASTSPLLTAAGQLLERTSVRDGRLIGQTFTPIRKDTRRDSVRLRDTVIDLVPDGIGVRLRPRLQPRVTQRS